MTVLRCSTTKLPVAKLRCEPTFAIPKDLDRRRAADDILVFCMRSMIVRKRTKQRQRSSVSQRLVHEIGQWRSTVQHRPVGAVRRQHSMLRHHGGPAIGSGRAKVLGYC